ncbi:MAG: Pr6Pr family membrane protein [Microbacteriaceae bacterium]|nr:Pr6Pr family membrane protein [Microbacteriaceae bacterium]
MPKPEPSQTPHVVALLLRRGLGVLNFVMAFAVAIALAVNISDRLIQGIFNPTHYFQYFTIQTSVINIVVLLIGGIFGVMRKNDPHWYSTMRASIVSYAIVTGVIYNLLLAGFPATDGYVASFSFPGDMQHIWAPLFIAVEWLLMPGRTRLRWGVLWISAVYPLVWVVGSLIRGLVGDGWFPYFFLNVTDMGIAGVVAYIAAIAAFVVGNAAIAVAVGRFHSRVFVGFRLDRTGI